MPPEPFPRPPDALLLSDVARVSKIMPWEGVGVALRAQVGHVVTYRGSLEGPNLPCVHQKVSKTVQKGVTPVFNRIFHCTTYLGGLHARKLVEVDFASHLMDQKSWQNGPRGF